MDEKRQKPEKEKSSKKEIEKRQISLCKKCTKDLGVYDINGGTWQGLTCGDTLRALSVLVYCLHCSILFLLEDIIVYAMQLRDEMGQQTQDAQLLGKPPGT